MSPNYVKISASRDKVELLNQFRIWDFKVKYCAQYAETVII